VLRRLIKVSAAVIGLGLAVSACGQVQMGAAAIVGNQRITIANLDTEVTNLSQAVKQYPGVATLTPAQETQATLTWLIRYQIYEKLASQAGITISPAQAQAALSQAVSNAESQYEQQQGLTHVTQDEVLALAGAPPDTSTELGRFEAIQNAYLQIANGGTLPTTSSAATAAENKLNLAACQAAKVLNIAVNPQFGQLNYGQYPYLVVAAPNPVTRSQGPTASASPIATAPAC
jgi:hypothetical protein